MLCHTLFKRKTNENVCAICVRKDFLPNGQKGRERHDRESESARAGAQTDDEARKPMELELQ